MDKLRINGKDHEFAAGDWPADIEELLMRLKIDRATVVAELDGRIIERKNFAVTRLKQGQTLELIRFVGGG